MGTTAKFIAIIYSAVVVIGFILAYAIYRSTRGDRKELDEEKAAHREKGWLAIVVGFLLITLFATIFLVPYGESAGPDAQRVTVVAQQFGFQLTPPSVKAGTPVEFVLTTKDTTHGFGVEYPSGGLVFQAQIVPEATQRVVHTFDKAGSYPVICLEYCGLGHHVMLAKLEVQ